MAFANLFTRLSVVEEDVRSPGQPAFTHRNDTDNGKRGNARKRKTQGEQAGPYSKKRCYQAQTTRTYNATSFKDDDSKAIRYHMQNTYSEHANVDFNKEVIHNQRNKAGYSNVYHKGQNYKTKNNHHANNQQQQKKKTERQNNRHQQKGRGKPANRGGSHQSRPTWRKGRWDDKDNKQDFQAKKTRSMTQEFMDQNALLVDGRLLCRHFMWGRCLKGDDCQLEHIQGYNDLIKEVCKFYVQGFCTKGDSCPYMHKSFPCKFFHKKGKCSQGADCRFSHEQLNDVTTKLLDEALKRDNDLYELAKKAEQESSGQPANTDESEILEANTTPDILLQPLRPNFYKSADTNAEKEALLCQTEELADFMKEAVPSHESNATQPHGPPSPKLSHEEPVCYSVEAVLGPQLSRPFSSFFTTPGSQQSAPLTSSDCTPGSANQSKVPYSVDAVLRSCKSVGYSTLEHTPGPPTAQIVSYSPKSYFENTKPFLNSEHQNEKVLYSINTRNVEKKSQEKMFKSLSSLQMHTGRISKTCPNLTLASGDHKKQGGDMPESLKPAQNDSHEVKLELVHSRVTVAEKSASSKSKGDMKGGTHLPTDSTCSVNCKSDGLPFGSNKNKSIFSRPPSKTPTSERPTQLTPHLSVQRADSQASVKPFYPSSGFTEIKGGGAAPVEPATSPFKTSETTNSVSSHFAAKQPTEIHLHSKKTQSDLKLGTEHHSTETTAHCSSKVAHCGDLAVGCKKTMKRPVHSLFAGPISDTLQPLDDSVTSSSCPQGLIQSSCPAPQSADCRSTPAKTVLEPDKASARSFLSLFAAPLSAAPLPHMPPQPDCSRTSSCSQQSNQSIDNTSHSSDSKQRASNLETPLPLQVRTDVKEISPLPRSPNFSSNPKIGNENSPEHVNQHTKQLLNPVCSLVSNSLGEMSTDPTPCGNSPFTTHVREQLPDISNHKVDSAAAATANSVLKTLFLCLSPYQQDSIQISVPSESDTKDKSSTGCVSEKQQQEAKKKGRRKKKLKTHDSHKQSPEETVLQPSEHQPFLQTHPVFLEATGGSSVGSPGMTESQERNSGTHNLPFKPVLPLMQHYTRSRLKYTSEEGKSVNGNMSATPLKDLFKTLDASVFHFGH
ncbi:uncharacterized protein LOC123969360 isoform X1 [Micropterus dolomieu]|uniref:uncharacterized protein LOC123969360 isoform X1 n=1 Tax=Micropterus dolomieu TaxID=147949 RepID=UPI001E8ED542|nr:uncharacterized protein LOC123969360 isoform X1 [Micropterus dolomieu]